MHHELHQSKVKSKLVSGSLSCKIDNLKAIFYYDVLPARLERRSVHAVVTECKDSAHFAHTCSELLNGK